MSKCAYSTAEDGWNTPGDEFVSSVAAPSVEIRRYDNAGSSPAWAMLPLAIAEMVANGWMADNDVGPSWNDVCLVAFSGDEPVGFMFYRHNDADGAIWAAGTWVKPEWRRKGIHRQLFETLERRAVDGKKHTKIMSIVHPTNRASEMSMIMQGRKCVGLVYEYAIRKYAEGEKA